MAGKVYISGINTSTLPTLSSEDMSKLMVKLKTGDKKAREDFIFCNMKLVLSVCQRFGDKRANMDDLFQVGCVGLIKAIDNFNLDLNVKFSTYAVPMIMGEIRRYLRDNCPVRVSRSMRDIAYKALKSRERLSKGRDYEPTIEEIVEDIDVPLRDVVCALDSMCETVSLEEPVFNDGQDALLVMDQIGENKDVSELERLSLMQSLNKLTKREKQILLMRYFIGKTQVEISNEVGISQAQVSRLEKTALGSIKRNFN